MGAVQKAMTDMALGKGQVSGFSWVAKRVGFDKAKMTDTFYVLQKLQEYAKTVPANVAKDVIGSFGVNEGTLAAMQRGAFSAKNLNAAPKYSEGEIKNLDKINVAWGNLGNRIEMAIGHFEFKARHCSPLVISKNLLLKF